MNYIELLKNSYKKYSSLLCLGLDPVIEDIPVIGTIEEKIYNFYYNILNKILHKKIFPSVIKPNYAFYAQYGFEGLHALLKVILLFKNEGFPVILDVKRGDIGKTAEAYAREAFDFFQADAVTLSPFMGYDSIHPFLSMYPGKGYYILTKTSNSSSEDFQDLLYNEKPLFMYIAQKITEWYKPGIGSVIGATYPEQLIKLTDIYINSNKEIPLLIPGVGTQGGDLAGVVNILKNYKDISIHRINSSSAINYAYKKHPGMKYDDAALLAIADFNISIEQSLTN